MCAWQEGMCSPNRDRHKQGMWKVGCPVKPGRNLKQCSSQVPTGVTHPQNTVMIQSRAQPCFFTGLVLVRFKLGANQSVFPALLQIPTDMSMSSRQASWEARDSRKEVLNSEAGSSVCVSLAQADADAEIPAAIGNGQELSASVKQTPWMFRVENNRGLNLETPGCQRAKADPLKVPFLQT